jgi:hypothetical protein
MQQNVAANSLKAIRISLLRFAHTNGARRPRGELAAPNSLAAQPPVKREHHNAASLCSLANTVSRNVHEF